MKTHLLLLFLIMLPGLCHGAMYKWTNAEGEIIYSDTPPNEDVEEIKLPALTTTPAVKYKPKPPPTEEAKPAPAYSSFTVLNPVKDAIIHDNNGNVAVSMSLTPELNTSAGHSISLLVDGSTKISKQQQTSLLLSNIDRGTHSLSAEIRDAKGQLLKKTSNSVSFTVYRYSKLHKKAPPPPPAN